MEEIRIRGFAPGDEHAFFALNAAWIERYFRMEEKDRKTLGDPHGQILSKGGEILIAEAGGEAIGCVALVPVEDGTWELAKMAVADAHQGRGVGRLLIAGLIERARSLGARRLFLETNSVLTPAIHLYERMGFVHLPHRPSEYARSNVQMELLL